MGIYVQLTDRCNMTCAHCCFACTGKGSMMTAEVFEKAIALAAEFSMDITIGGGEPTLHPKCLDWVMQAALATVDVSMDMDCPAVMIITNGKRGAIAEKLAKLAKLGIIQAELSQDEYHDPIDPRTVETFKRYAGFRDVTKDGRYPVVDVGRATENSLFVKDGCACSALFIAPSGDFYQCGCKKTKLGNILTDAIPQDYFEHADECEQEKEKVYA